MSLYESEIKGLWNFLIPFLSAETVNRFVISPGFGHVFFKNAINVTLNFLKEEQRANSSQNSMDRLVKKL